MANRTSAGTPQAQVVPFLYEDARIYVPVRIGAGPSRWFILDTGATGTIIDSALAKSMHLRVSGAQTVHGAGSGGSQQAQTGAVRFMVGDVPLVVAQPAVMDLAHLLGPTSGRPPDGIIGSQFFREHFVDVDFAQRRISVYPPEANRRSSYAAAVPLTFVDSTPLTPVLLTLPSGRTTTANALVDLGAKATFLVPEPFIDREKLRDAFSTKVVTGFGAGVGGDTFYAFGRARRLGFAGEPRLSLERPVVGLSVKGTLRSTWHQGLLGAEFLAPFKLGFDYRHKRLLLTQRSNEVAPFDRSGLFLAASGSSLKQLVVRSVVENGPAALAGLAPGDEILSIDGSPTADLGLDEVRNRLKNGRAAAVIIEYLRGTERHAVRLGLRDLL